MPALNFHPRFAPLVESGGKRQTLRRVRKLPIRVGDRLIFYTGQRTKGCRWLGEGRCFTAAPFTIEPTLPFFWLNGIILTDTECHSLAQADGFRTVADMVIWFNDKYRLPFSGVLIRW